MQVACIFKAYCTALIQYLRQKNEDNKSAFIKKMLLLSTEEKINKMLSNTDSSNYTSELST